jgi:hypothetical protein
MLSPAKRTPALDAYRARSAQTREHGVNKRQPSEKAMLPPPPAQVKRRSSSDHVQNGTDDLTYSMDTS